MKKALIIVDMQKDFCEGGSLSVPGGNSIVSVINRIKEKFIKDGDIVVASRELHPMNHTYFASVNDKNSFDLNDNCEVLWPDHCVYNTDGCEFHDDLDLTKVEIFTKGKDVNHHPFSAFYGISDKHDIWLYDYLKENEVGTVYVVGLAMEFCVLETAIDAAKDFKTYVVLNATSWITEDGKKRAMESFKKNNIENIIKHF